MARCLEFKSVQVWGRIAAVMFCVVRTHVKVDDVIDLCTADRCQHSSEILSPAQVPVDVAHMNW